MFPLPISEGSEWYNIYNLPNNFQFSEINKNSSRY